MTSSLYRARHAGGQTWENIFTASQANLSAMAGGQGWIFSGAAAAILMLTQTMERVRQKYLSAGHEWSTLLESGSIAGAR